MIQLQSFGRRLLAAFDVHKKVHTLFMSEPWRIWILIYCIHSLISLALPLSKDKDWHQWWTNFTNCVVFLLLPYHYALQIGSSDIQRSNFFWSLSSLQLCSPKKSCVRECKSFGFLLENVEGQGFVFSWLNAKWSNFQAFKYHHTRSIIKARL